MRKSESLFYLMLLEAKQLNEMRRRMALALWQAGADERYYGEALMNLPGTRESVNLRKLAWFKLYKKEVKFAKTTLRRYFKELKSFDSAYDI